jgi:hypothetical protein
LRWKSGLLVFQSPSWKSGKSGKAKASFETCNVLCRERKLRETSAVLKIKIFEGK